MLVSWRSARLIKIHYSQLANFNAFIGFYWFSSHQLLLKYTKCQLTKRPVGNCCIFSKQSLSHHVIKLERMLMGKADRPKLDQIQMQSISTPAKSNANALPLINTDTSQVAAVINASTW